MINPKDYHILLAEDDDWLRGTFSILLERQGFLCTTVQDGKELYAEASKGNSRLNPNLVIVSDTNMPYMDGDVACKKLLDEFPEYGRRIIVGMSDNPDNEKHWKGIGVLQTFIYKGSDITNPESRKNLGKLVFNRINKITNHPSFYLDDNKNLIRKLTQQNI